MANKNNNLKYQKELTLKNASKEFIELAKKVEKLSPIGWTSGLGQDNYYKSNGLAYDSYTEAVNDLAKRLKLL